MIRAVEGALEEERDRVLSMVQAGKISAEEGMQLLDAMEGKAPSGEGSPAAAPSGKMPEAQPSVESAAIPAMPRRWAYYWLYVMGIGLGISLLGASLLAWLQALLGFTFWSVCGSLPLLVGLLTMLAAIWSVRATWFHLRITDMDDGRRSFAISLPLPLGVAVLALRVTRRVLPELRERPELQIDELVAALREGTLKGDRLIVDVFDHDERKRIQVSVG